MKSNKLVWFLVFDLIFFGAFAFWYVSVRNDPEETTFTEIIDEVSDEARNFTVTRDQVYADPVDSQRQILDVYEPKEDSIQARPLVVWIHGGGWVAGDKNDDAPFQPLIDAGFVVASINYRYASEAPHPAQVNDVNMAVKWLRDNSTSYNIDVDNVALMGFSAGGHLATLAAYSGNTDAFDQPQAVQAVVAFAAPVDLVNFEQDYTDLFDTVIAENENIEAAKILLDCPTLEQCNNALFDASPLTYVDPQDPPSLLQYGQLDQVVPVKQGQRLLTLLESLVPGTEYFEVQDGGHEYDVNEQVVGFLKEKLQ